MKKVTGVSVLILLTCSFLVNAHPLNNPSIFKKDLDNHWQLQSSADIKTTHESEISTLNFSTQEWHQALVPGTVLGSLVADGDYKNIFYGRNLEKIPESRFAVPWWYRTVFELEEIIPGQRTHLKFNGISYRADVWINGRKVVSADSIKGSFRQFTLDISSYVQPGKNVLAVKVFRAEPGDLNIGFVDWNPEPADHNMGIWRNVELHTSGPVYIDQPFVKTLVDTVSLKHASLIIHTRVNNPSDKAIYTILNGSVGPEITFSKKVKLEPHSSQNITFSPDDFPVLNIQNPKLWWVHTMGEPYLYNLKLEAVINDKISDESNTRFGIRTVTDYLTPEGHRGFAINGKRILIKGGGWTDPMLLNATPAYEQAGIDYAVHMNLNALRMEGFWGTNEHLYNLCDEKGILLMVGFSCQWEWGHLIGNKGNKEDKYGALITPEQENMAAASWHDQLLWLRNHPSIFTWLYGSDKWPQPELEKRYLEICKEIDPTRPSVSSAKEVRSVVTGRSAVKMRGPYDYVPPVYWYADTTLGGAFGFNTETGPGPQIPVLESLQKMIPSDSLWPINSAWMYHAARGKFHNLTSYNQAMDERLGKAENLKDYLRKAQYLNYEGMRAMYEAFESNQPRSTGIIQWMYNASWPKLWWQLYDYYLMPTGAFYGARVANEPVHISYNYGTHSIEVMNNTNLKTGNLTAEITAYDFNLKTLLKKETTVTSLSSLSVENIFKLPEISSQTKTWFLDLRLLDEGKNISRNFYVLSTQKDVLDFKKSTWYITPQSQFADMTSLQQLPAVTLKKEETISEKDGSTYVTLKLKNTGSHLAFMVYLDMKKSTTNESISPVFWNDNFFTLLPGEETVITGYCLTPDLKGEKIKISVSGWNVE